MVRTLKRGWSIVAAAAIFIFFCCPPTVRSAGPGTTAVPFLKMDSGARPAAMGGVFSSIADDANTLQYNPGGLGLINRRELLLSHNEWIGGVRTETLSYIHPAGDKWTLGLGLNYLFTEPSDARDRTGNLTGGKVRENNGVVSFGIGREIAEDLYAGGVLKIIRQSAGGNTGLAKAADFGVLKVMSRLGMGFSIQNIGTKMKIAEDEFPLPLIVRAGANYRLKGRSITGAENYTFIGLDAVKVRDRSAEIRIGAEICILGLFTINEDATFIRAGYQPFRERGTGAGIAGGFGIRGDKGNVQFDYAFVPFGEFGLTHRISVTLRFGKSREEDSRNW